MRDITENELLQDAHLLNIKIYPGTPYPLGVTWDGRGVNFAVFSENAERMELCLFKPDDNERQDIVKIEEITHHLGPASGIMGPKLSKHHFKKGKR